MKIHYITSLAIVLGLAGCGNSSAPTETKPTTTESTATDNKASNLPADAPTYRVGTTGTSTPLSFQDENGQLTGIDVDIIRNIGEREGFKIEFIPTKWNDLFIGLEGGKFDIVISGTAYNEERASKYGVSDSYFFSPAAIAYIDGKTAKPIHTVTDLQGLKVGALAGSKNEKIAQSSGAAEVVTAQRGFEVFTMLVQNQIDAFVHGYVVLRDYQKNYPDQKLVIRIVEDESQKNAHLVILTQKGNQELIDKLNSGINKLKADGTIDKISDKYLGNTK